MNKTVLALSTALLLASGAATSASAQTSYSYDTGTVTYVNDVDHDGVPNAYDPYDNRYPRAHIRTVVALDKDCDGVPDLYDPDMRNLEDADCDGIRDRFDSRYGQPYTALPSNPPLYTSTDSRAPRIVRYRVGSYLPASYYGDPYYVDYVQYNLTPPPYGYRWNRVGNDVYLISTTDGHVSVAMYDYFH